MKRNGKNLLNMFQKLEEPTDSAKIDSSKSKSKSISLLMDRNTDSEYQKIRYKIIQNGSISKKQGAAVLIQSTWRMYRFKIVFDVFVKKYRVLKYKIEFPYFAALALKSRIVGIDRKQLFDRLVSHSIWNPNVLYKNKYRLSSFQNFTNTEQFLCPVWISDKNMIKFVRLFYQSLLRKVLEEWILVTKIAKRKRRPFRLDHNARLQFGVEFNAFHMWLRYTKLKIFKRKEKLEAQRKKYNFVNFDDDSSSTVSYISGDQRSTSQISSFSDISKSTIKRNRRTSHYLHFSSSVDVPTWPNYEVSVQAQRAKEQKADLYRENTIKTNVIQSLSNLMFRKKENQESRESADLFYNRKNMTLAYLAWQTYIQNNNSRNNILRSILKTWFFIAKRRKHFFKLSELFKDRHDMYEKRKLLSALIKNRKISKIQTAYIYSKLQVKHSLASWFVFTLQNDKNEAPLSLSLYAWIQYVRRRKMWHNFVFLDLKSTQYDSIKQKGYYAIIKGSYTPITPSLLSDPFKEQTIQLAQQIEFSKEMKTPMYLLTSDHSVQTKLNQAKTIFQRRQLFFDTWSTMMAKNYDPSLFIRICILNKMKKENDKGKKVRMISERNRDTFRKAIRHLLQIDVGSMAKLRKVLDLIDRNTIKALYNRSRCLHRDNMLLEAFKSHNRANELHELNSSFSVNDTFLLFSQIKETNDEIANSYQYEELIDELDLSDPNERSFSDINGCLTPPRPTPYFISLIRTDFKQIMNRSDITGITAFHLGNKHGYRSKVTLGVKSYSRVEPYSGKNKSPSQIKRNAILEKLKELFPSFGRAGHALDREATKEDHILVLKILGREEEEKPEVKQEEETKNEELEEKSRKEKLFEQLENKVEDEDKFDPNKSQSPIKFPNLEMGKYKFSQSMPSFEGEEKSLFANDKSEEEDLKFPSFPNEELEEQISLQDVSGSRILSDISSHSNIMREISLFDSKSDALLKELPNPETLSKYKTFLEILFGRGTFQDRSDIQTLRQYLMYEYRLRRPGYTGMDIKAEKLPVSGILEGYRNRNTKTKLHDNTITRNAHGSPIKDTSNSLNTSNNIAAISALNTISYTNALTDLTTARTDTSSNLEGEGAATYQTHTLNYGNFESEGEDSYSDFDIDDEFLNELSPRSRASRMSKASRHSHISKNSRISRHSRSSKGSKHSRSSKRSKLSGSSSKLSNPSLETDHSSNRISELETIENENEYSDHGHGNDNVVKVKVKNKVKKPKTKVEKKTDQKTIGKNQIPKKGQKGQNSPSKTKAEKKSVEDENEYEYEYEYDYDYEYEKEDYDYSHEGSENESEKEKDSQFDKYGNRTNSSGLHSVRSKSSKYSSGSKRSQLELKETPFINANIMNSNENIIGDIDKIVYGVLEQSINDGDGQADLIAVEGEEEAQDEDDIPMDRPQNHPRLYRPPKAPKQFQPHSPKATGRSSKDKTKSKGKAPIVLSHEPLKNLSSSEVINHTPDNDFGRLIFDNGTTLYHHKKTRSPVISTHISVVNSPRDGVSVKNKVRRYYDKNLNDRYASPSQLKGFQLEGQVVSFPGKKRWAGTNTYSLHLHQKPIAPLELNSINNKKTSSMEQMSYTSLCFSQKPEKADIVSSNIDDSLNSVINQFIQMMSGAQDDPEEFEKLRKRTQMLRKRPTFAGIYGKVKDPSEFYFDLQSAYIQYSRRHNTKQAANDLYALMQQNPKYGAQIAKVIEKVAKEKEIQQFDKKSNVSSKSKSSAQLLELEWLEELEEDYGGVILQYTDSKSQPLKAIVAPYKKKLKENSPEKNTQRLPFDVINYGTNKQKVPIKEKTYEQQIKEVSLEDLILITPMVIPLEFVDYFNQTFK